LGICIPVGKDSLSMRMAWQDELGEKHSVVSPLSLIISAFSPVSDIRNTLTPHLQALDKSTELLFIDLGRGHQTLGGTALAQVFGQIGDEAADVRDPETLKAFFTAIQTLNRAEKLLAYHDRSDGGLWVTLCEMAFASHVGLDIELNALRGGTLAGLFTEELGAVIQVKQTDKKDVLMTLAKAGLEDCTHSIATLNKNDQITITKNNATLFTDTRINLHRLWAETSYRLQALRDNPECAQEEYDNLLDDKDPGLSPQLHFNPQENIAASFINQGVKPTVIILREQGVNGHMEMAAAFERAGFLCVDVHMSDILSGDILGSSLGIFRNLKMPPRSLSCTNSGNALDKPPAPTS